MQKRLEFTSDWFSNNIPRFTKHLLHLSGVENVRVLEIGSWEGRSTCWLLDNIVTGQGSTITCVDTWNGSDERAHDAERDNIWNRFKGNISNYPTNKIIVKRGLSRDRLKDADHGLYDFIYVDGSHTARDVMEDAVLAFDLLKENGVMIFDDYLWGLDSLDPIKCPKPGIDAFLMCYNGRYELLELAYQVTVKKLTD